MMKFDLPTDNSSIIKVIGVGGGGSNAVNHMYKQGIKGVDFIVCNTDQQSLDISPVPLKIVLGATLTKGRGAGALPEVGRNAAIETIEEIKLILGNNTEMLFITAGLGGGTGTGAAPIIAQAAKELGILTVGIVTIPFGFEGKKRKAQADAGLEALKQHVDTLLIISNDKLREIYGNLKVTEAFGHADDILTTAAKGIAEIITTTLQINTDINDVKTVMKDSGVAIMGSAQASGEQRSLRAVEQAMSSPLLNDSNIKGARYVLVNVTCGEDEITMDELGEITDYIQDAAGMSAEVIKGYGVDASLGDKVNVTIIATGFNSKSDLGIQIEKAPEKIILFLDDKGEQTSIAPAPIAEFPATEINKVELESTSFVDETTKLNEASIVEQAAENVDANEPFLFIKEETFIEETPEFVAQSNEIVFEFDVKSNVEPNDDFTFVQKNNEEIKDTANEQNKTKDIDFDFQQKKSEDRVTRLRELSYKIKTANGVSELESEPAYKRKNIQLDSTPHSSESSVSRYTLSETDDKKVEIKPNNTFLHDNVD
jgi:cell division protein FtsZ